MLHELFKFSVVWNLKSKEPHSCLTIDETLKAKAMNTVNCHNARMVMLTMSKKKGNLYWTSTCKSVIETFIEAKAVI
jgi:hypothetical protein